MLTAVSKHENKLCMRASHRVSIKYMYFVIFVVNLKKNICAHLHLFYKKMHGMESFKTIGAQQAKLTNNYKNIKYKLLKTNRAIWCNKTCSGSHLIPK